MSASVYGPIPASNLTNASVTVNPATDSASEYVMPTATMSANRTVTLGTTGSPATNDVVRVICNDFAGHNLVIANGGVGGGTLFTFSGTPATSLGASFYFDGTNWKFLSTYPIVALALPNSNLATMAADTIKGNNTGSSATPSDLTVSQVNTMLGLFSGSVTTATPVTSLSIAVPSDGDYEFEFCGTTIVGSGNTLEIQPNGAALVGAQGNAAQYNSAGAVVVAGTYSKALIGIQGDYSASHFVCKGRFSSRQSQLSSHTCHFVGYGAGNWWGLGAASHVPTAALTSLAVVCSAASGITTGTLFVRQVMP